jgi:hypothetical protein
MVDGVIRYMVSTYLGRYLEKINLRWTRGTIYTGLGPPKSKNPTSSLALFNMWSVATNSDILDGVWATVFIV